MRSPYKYPGPPEELRKKFQLAYKRIAAGEISKSDAANELGYTCFGCLESIRRRLFPEMPSIRTMTESHEHLKQKFLLAYKRIDSGKAGKDEAAKDIGFPNYSKMEKKRILSFPDVPSLAEMEHARKQKKEKEQKKYDRKNQYRMTVNERREKRKQEILSAYQRIAAGEIDKEDAAKELGYACFSYMDNRRVCTFPQIPSLRKMGFRTNGAGKATSDEIEEAYYEIATSLEEGKDIRQEQARKLGFTSFQQMDSKRIRLDLPSLREISYDLFPEKEEAYHRRASNTVYQRHKEELTKKYHANKR